MTSVPSSTGQPPIPKIIPLPHGCIGCGKLKKTDGMLRCEGCFSKKAPALYCKWCRHRIDAYRRNYAKKFRKPDGTPSEATQCDTCAHSHRS